MVCIIGSVVATIVNICLFDHMGLVDLLRPVIVMLLFRSQRQTAQLIFLNIQDSMTVLSIIFVFILYWAATGKVLFYGSFEGVVEFPDFTESYWTGVVFLTTESYPFNLFLPYKVSWLYSLFYLFFIFFAIFFLLNILIAIVFDNYKKRVYERQKRKLAKRLAYVEMYFE